MESRMDRLYRLVELLPNLPIWGGEEALSVQAESPLPVERALSRPSPSTQALTQTGLSERELATLLQADSLAQALMLPAELLPTERWLQSADLDAPPDAWWRLSLPIIGPQGTLLLLELCTPEGSTPMQFFSPRGGRLQRLD